MFKVNARSLGNTTGQSRSKQHGPWQVTSVSGGFHYCIGIAASVCAMRSGAAVKASARQYRSPEFECAVYNLGQVRSLYIAPVHSAI